jgi:hypothetical protein
MLAELRHGRMRTSTRASVAGFFAAALGASRHPVRSLRRRHRPERRRPIPPPEAA